MATSITFLCLALDHENNPLGSTFVLRIPFDALVSDLQKAIKNEKPHDMDQIDANRLILWKLWKPPRIGLTTVENKAFKKQIMDIVLPSPDADEALEGNGVVQLVDAAVEISYYWKERPEPMHLHLIVQVPFIAGATILPMSVHEISRSLLDKWNTAFALPLDIDYLHAHLDAPLNSDEKIPIPPQEWKRLLLPNPELRNDICDADLGRLFRVSTDEIATGLWYQLHEVIARGPPDPLGTEESFHSFWDRNILDLLTQCLDGSSWIRNGNQGTQTGALGPNLGLLLDSTCIFRGEEKRAGYSGKHPGEELAEKTRWVYDPAPYVLGYHAIGARVTIVAIKPKEPGQKTVGIKDLVTENLSTRRGRLRNATRIIRLVKILRTLERVVGKGADADMLPLKREQGKMIEFFEMKIRKTYQAEDQNRVLFLKIIYEHLRVNQVPNVDSLKRSEIAHAKHGCFVELEPRGINAGPKCVDDVKNAVFSVLEALQVLHTSEPNIYHRDIRWPNVMQRVDNPNKWFLIDWEDAAISPTRAAPTLNFDTHSPRVFEDGHGAEVDIWGVGRLITGPSTFGLPNNLYSLGQRMVDGSIISAQQALEELKSL